MKTKPCKDCPFSKRSQPGALGGSPPDVYIGQVNGPFLLPCHKHCDFDDPEWRTPDKQAHTQQCRGAAIFRTHQGIDVPGTLLKLPADEDVFADEAEFLAHHTGVELQTAKAVITPQVIDKLVRRELFDVNAKVTLMSKS